MVGVASAALVLAMASLADAQVFYSYPGARPVTDTSPSLGLVSGFGDNVIRLGGFGRFNISPVADLGLEAIYQSVDVSGSGNDIGYGGAGIDGKYLLMSANENMPLDISAQVGAGFLARSGYFNLHIPFGAMTSHDFTTSDGRRITPYGGVYFVFDYFNVDSPGGNSTDSDFDVEMRVGAAAEIVKRGSLFAALHAGNGTMFFLGFNAGL